MANHEASHTLIGVLRNAAQSYPEKRAISFAGKFEISHSRLQELVDDSASVLQSAGVSTGDVVALAIPNSIELAIMLLAVIRAGGVAAPLNPAFTQEEFELYLLESKLLLTDSNGNPSAQAAASKLGIIQVVVSLPDPASLVHISVPTGNGDSTHNLVHDFSNHPSDVALVLHTSGTTSRPKVVPLTQHNLAASVQNITSVYRMTDCDSTVVGLPLFDVHGLLAGLLSPLSAGGSVTLLASFSASSLLDGMRATCATWYTAVPTVHQLLLDYLATKPEQYGHLKLRFINSCTTPLAPAIFERFESAFKAPVLEAYSMMEASHLICSNPLPQDGLHKPGSVGKPVGQELAVLDDKGVPQLAGAVGEVCIRGPNVTKGYKNNPQANEAAFLFGWFHTGDLGYLDEDGYLHLVGRVNELINNGGIGGDTDSPISVPAPAVDIALNMEALMSTLVDYPLNNIGPNLGFEISLSEGPEQNTGSPGGGLGPNETNWIQWSGVVDAFNFVSDATLGVTLNLTNLFMNRSNNIWQLAFLAGANLFFNTLVAVNYFYGEGQEAHGRNWRAELIASVGAPIAASVVTLLSSFRFASDPERWSNWIAELSRLNAAMIVAGPFAFYWMSNRVTEN